MRLIVLIATPCETSSDAAAGQVVAAEGDEFVVNTGEGCLQLLRIRPEGKGDLTAAEFLRGRQLTAECRLGSDEK